MKTIVKLGLGLALLTLAAGCGTETPSAENQALANEQNIVANSLIVDPEIPNAAVETNGAAVAPPAAEQAGADERDAVKVAPAPPPAPKAPSKAKAEAPKPKAPPPATDPHAGHDMNEM